MRKIISLAIVTFLLVAGCRAANAPGETISSGIQSQIRYSKDDAHKVGCWVYVDDGSASISCLPYEQYLP